MIERKEKYSPVALTRISDPARLYRIAHHPDVFPWIKGPYDIDIVLDTVVSNPDCYALLGQYGFSLYAKLGPGIYEAHNAVLPEGRGRWTLQMAKTALHWMFTRTDCTEIITKCPLDNLAAIAGARAVGGQCEFTTRPIWPGVSGPIGLGIYTLPIQRWVEGAKDLIQRGQDFHDQLRLEYWRLGVSHELHESDPLHDKYVGMACDMIEGNQLYKAVLYYNRWAIFSGYELIGVKSLDPLVIDIGEALLAVKDGSFEVLSCR